MTTLGMTFKLAGRPRYAKARTKDEVLVGNCSADTNPDAWFPETTRGTPSKEFREKLRLETNRAIALCNSCPVQEKCLRVGMEPDKLQHGIRGGKLPDERIALSGIDAPKYSYAWQAIKYSNTLRKYI